MSLQEWLDKYPQATDFHVGLSTELVGIYYYIWIRGMCAWELWHLSDYIVSSVSGGVIWLWPKE